MLVREGFHWKSLIVLDLIGASLPIAVGSITSYDPKTDSDGRIAGAIPQMVELLARPGHGQGAI